MARHETPDPQNSQSADLRANILRLFTADYCRIVDNPPSRNILLGKETFRRYYPNNVPQEAREIMREGYEMQNGALRYSLYRGQHITKYPFVPEVVTGDFVSCSMNDDDYSGGPRTTRVYGYRVDLLVPPIPYDEKFARIIQICLEAAQND